MCMRDMLRVNYVFLNIFYVSKHLFNSVSYQILKIAFLRGFEIIIVHTGSLQDSVIRIIFKRLCFMDLTTNINVMHLDF
jgi:hypothetical protein